MSLHITEARTQTILSLLGEDHHLDWCSQYGERGYHDPEKGILFADWNPISKRLCNYLEEAGYELEWSDEWYVDNENDKAWRTSPDSYGWVCQVAFAETGILTPDDSIDEWIEEFQITGAAHPMRALPDWISQEDLEERGWNKYNGTFESGWYPGQTDDPKVVTKLLLMNYPAVIFRIDAVGQFDLKWEAYFLPDDAITQEDA